MATFVLVHGAWQSVATWDLVAPLLQQAGHTVVTPVLSGLGTSQVDLSPNVSLTQHIRDVNSVLIHLKQPVVLVGHSYAGMIISGVAEQDASMVRHLVFLDAFIPADGQSTLDLLPPDIGSYFHNVARDHGDGWRLPGGEGQLDLWGLKPGEARDFVRARLCDFSLRCFQEPIHLPNDRKSSLPGTFVSCVAEEYPAKPFFLPFAEKARAYGWPVVPMNTGHDCHVERPRDVAEILLSTIDSPGR
ncbi:MAG: alpha/beta hydrolase [Bryobacterales bacterium]|nr:alpha/beta hydrolase [Bryobacterales bacterium]